MKYLLLLLHLSCSVAATKLPLSVLLWKSSEFIKSFNGSYRINSELEPTLSSQERGLLVQMQGLMQKNNRQGVLSKLKESPLLKTSPSIQYNYANVLREEGRVDEAIGYYLKALDKLPSFRRAHQNLGIAYVQVEKLEEGKLHLLEAIKLGSADGFVHGFLGYCFMAEERYEAALLSYRNAVTATPDVLDWRLGLARSLQGLKRNQEALNLYQGILKEDAENLYVQQQVAWIYLAENQVSKAIPILEYLRRKNYLQPVDQIRLGSLLITDGNIKIGSDLLKATIGRAEFKDIKAALGVVRFCIQAQELELAEKIQGLLSTKALSVAEKVTLRRLRARLFFAKKDNHPEGIEILNDLIKKDPTDAASLTLLGQQLVLGKKPHQAMLRFEQALNVNEKALTPRLELAKVLVDLKFYEKGIQNLEYYLSVSEDPKILEYLQAVQRINDSYKL